jgi:hypothetical protein
MNSRILALSAIALATSLPSFATTATSLSSFGGLEESAQKYFPSSNTFQSDSFANCVDEGGGVFKMILRYNSSGTMWWDGDRTTGNTDRGREEVKTLGTHQLIHQTFDYTTTWRVSSGFKGSGSFCHITQLKPVDGVEGSSGAPLVVTSINSGSSSAVVRYASASFSPANQFTTRTVRNITYSPGTYTAEKIRVTTTADNETTGKIQVSLNGDSLTGLTNIEVCRPSSTEYYPKWGLYRGTSTSSGFGSADYVEHSNVTAGVASGGTPPPTVTFEAESMSATTSGTPTITTQSDSSASGGVVAFVNATASGQWAQFTTPSIVAGTYQVKFAYKHNTARGQHTVTIDGTQVGGTVDEYSSTSGYTTVTLGNVTLAAGTHAIRLTITGKNGSSSAYTLAPDAFTLVGQ